VSPDHEHESPFDKLMALSIVEGRAHLFPAMERRLGNKELSEKRRAATSRESRPPCADLLARIAQASTADRDRAKTISAEKVCVPFSLPFLTVFVLRWHCNRERQTNTHEKPGKCL